MRVTTASAGEPQPGTSEPERAGTDSELGGPRSQRITDKSAYYILYHFLSSTTSSLFTGATRTAAEARARPTATHATVKAAELGRQRHTTVNTQSLNYDIRDLLHTTQGEGEKAEAGNPMHKLPAHTSNRLHRFSILYRSCVHS